MKRSKRRELLQKVTEVPQAPHRYPAWLGPVLLGVVLIGVGVTIWLVGRPKSEAGGNPSQAVSSATTLQPASPASSPLIPDQMRQRLVGRWLRPDGGYIMTIVGVGEDGSVEATYENPRPIHVEQASARQVNGKTSLFLTLRDRNYPGNNYELDFDSAKDQLVGVYHHLGVHQDFDVYFEHLK